MHVRRAAWPAMPYTHLYSVYSYTVYASEGIHPGFETQGRRHQKSKTGVSVAPQKGLVSYKIFLKKKKKKKKEIAILKTGITKVPAG